MRNKTLNATKPDQVLNVEIFGDPQAWKLLCKACCHDEGWMKSTKAMEIPGFGCLVQVTTHQVIMGGNDHAVAEALTLVPEVRIVNDYDEGGRVVGRRLVSWRAGEPMSTKTEASDAPRGYIKPYLGSPDDTQGEKTDAPEVLSGFDDSRSGFVGSEEGPMEMEGDDIDGLGPLQQGTQETLE